jgi:hypothetical protein
VIPREARRVFAWLGEGVSELLFIGLFVEPKLSSDQIMDIFSERAEDEGRAWGTEG